MLGWLLIALSALHSSFARSVEPQLGNIALRHQLGVLRRSSPERLKITASDRMLWVQLRRLWPDLKAVLVIVKPETVVGWHR